MIRLIKLINTNMNKMVEIFGHELKKKQLYNCLCLKKIKKNFFKKSKLEWYSKGVLKKFGQNIIPFTTYCIVPNKRIQIQYFIPVL